LCVYVVYKLFVPTSFNCILSAWRNKTVWAVQITSKINVLWTICVRLNRSTWNKSSDEEIHLRNENVFKSHETTVGINFLINFVLYVYANSWFGVKFCNFCNPVRAHDIITYKTCDLDVTSALMFVPIVLLYLMKRNYVLQAVLGLVLGHKMFYRVIIRHVLARSP